MSNYAQHVSTKRTPQSQPVLGRQMVKNSAGGHTFELSDWDRLERFLILGQEGPTYYATERKIVVQNAKCILRCAKEDPARTVETIVQISEAGRAPKNDPAIFALALLAGQGGVVASHALKALPRVCRIGTHLFQFIEAVKQFRGFGPALRKAVGGWYLDKTAERLAYQVIKYQQRNGWSHRDVLRLSHPSATDHRINQVLRYVVGKESESDIPLLEGFERIKRVTSAKEAARLVSEYNLPRECVPTQFLNSVEVWDALLDKMPMTAMIRNLGKMSSIGLIKPLSDATEKVRQALTDKEALTKARVHPIQLLVAQRVYQNGRGHLGSLSWTVDQQIVQALDDAFELAFDSVVPAGKRFLLALDVSASMSWPRNQIAGTFLTPREASAAMALVTTRTEPRTHVVGFTSGPNGMLELNITPKQNLRGVIDMVSGLPHGGTDCALPMIYAEKAGLEVDTFVVYTDNETYAGNIHPFQALRQYRQSSGISDAKLVVVGMVANNFTIADSQDGGMLDVVGFDTSTPNLISDFARG